MSRRLVLVLLSMTAGVACEPLRINASPSSAARLSLNEVAFLFPLPASGVQEELLGLDGLLERRVLDLTQDIEPLLPDAGTTSLYARSRVVSARIDPCFPVGDGGCARQVRLVAQPLSPEGVTEDAALHLFYPQSEGQWAALMQGLQALHHSYGATLDGTPLGVHPVMAQEGLSGPYATALKTLLRTHCTTDGLSRVALMSTRQKDAAWVFGTFDLAPDGGLVPLDIPRLQKKTRQSVTEFGTTARPETSIGPAPPNAKLSTLLSSTEVTLADTKTLQDSYDEAHLLENPLLSSPLTADCASCHVATRARELGEQLRGPLPSAQRFTLDGAPLQRVGSTGIDPRSQRAFGYFDTTPAFSQRTIHEAAQVAKVLGATWQGP